MNVYYTDTQGRKWAFAVEGTPYQIRLFRRVLSALRGVTGGERLSLSYLADTFNNDAFTAEVEAVALSALSQRFPVDPQGFTPPPPFTSTAQDQEQADAVTVSRSDADTGKDTEAENERITYYWENF